MQGKFPRSALLITSFLALSLTTSGVYAGIFDKPKGNQAQSEKFIDFKSLFSWKKKKDIEESVKKAPAKVKPSVKKVKSKPVTVKKKPKKVVSAKSLPVVAPSPVPAPKRDRAAVDQVQETLKQLQIMDEQDAKKLLPVNAAKSVNQPATEEQAPVKTVAGQLAPLGFADASWEDAVEGFRFHAAAARRLMTEGRPDLAVAEVALARANAGSVQEVNEAGLLQAVTEVMIGKEVQSPIVRGANHPADWKAIEVARAEIAGEKSSYSVLSAIEEVAKWPDPVAALVVRHFAPLVDKKSADVLVALADRLNASGTLSPTVVPLVRGYSQKLAGDQQSALASFEAASTSVLGGVASQAKLELLEAGISAKSLSPEEISAAATDIVNIKTNDHVERRALRILADNAPIGERINALRALENAEYSIERKAAVKAELDKVIEQVAVEAEKVAAQQKEADEAKLKAEKSQEAEVHDVEQAEPTWLLDDQEPTDKKAKAGSVSIKTINKALSETNEIIRSFEQGK